MIKIGKKKINYMILTISLIEAIDVCDFKLYSFFFFFFFSFLLYC